MSRFNERRTSSSPAPASRSRTSNWPRRSQSFRTRIIKLSGTTSVEDALNQLPSATAVQAGGLPNPSTGTAEIDLRYLGAKRTLTLVNGRRLTPGDPNGTTQAGDINIIPASMLKRVEVLTGGASSVYGADAVAGVVNFIMDTDFDGLRLDGQISGYQHDNDCPSIGGGNTVCDELDRNTNVLHRVRLFSHPTGSHWDGKNIDVTASFGAGFDDGRGHVMGYFGYRKQNAILQGARDYSRLYAERRRLGPHRLIRQLALRRLVLLG